jgi:hypothetical protein
VYQVGYFQEFVTRCTISKIESDIIVIVVVVVGGGGGKC